MTKEILYTGDRSQTVRLGKRTALRLGDLRGRDQCNTGIVRTRRGLILIDYPEQSPDEEILDEAQNYFGLPVTHIILSHAHGDHRNGLATLHRRDRDIRLIGRRNALQETAALYPGLELPTREVRDGEQLDLDGVPFAFFLPQAVPAHSPWDMSILLPEDGIAFTGDFVVPPHYLYAHSSNIQNWLSELKRFSSAAVQPLLAMGHGEPQERGEALDAFGAYLIKLSQLSGALHTQRLPIPRASEELPEGPLTSLFDTLSGITDAETVLRQLRELEQRFHDAGCRQLL